MKAFFAAIGAAAMAILALAAGNAAASKCSDCHSCEQPTAADPCLSVCLREAHEPDWRDFERMKPPTTVVLDELAALYNPVVFDHQGHAGMSGMGGGNCRVCHHDNPSHAIGGCSDCHPSAVAAGKVQTDLKTAYHRQCMLCHRDWSQETDCEICHAPASSQSASGGKAAPGKAPQDEAHAFIHRELPSQLVFETSHQPGPYVTFDHKSHTQDHGLNCLECHVADNCSACHHPSEERFQGKLHDFSDRDTCGQCHQMSTCGTCHARQPKRGFSHDLTGWPLGRYHQKLACERCHEAPKAHRVMPRECNGCHNLWEEKDFDHASLIGVDLGEEHAGLSCADCHQDAGYTTPPACAQCHDDGRGPELLR